MMSDCAIMHVSDLLAKTPLHPGRIAQVSKKCEKGFRTHKRWGPILTLKDKPTKRNETKRNEMKRNVHRRAGTDLVSMPRPNQNPGGPSERRARANAGSHSKVRVRDRVQNVHTTNHQSITNHMCAVEFGRSQCETPNPKP
jgi:hypothetical protein